MPDPAASAPPPAAARIAGRVRPRDAATQAWQARLDAAVDGWPDEAWAVREEARLASEFAAALDPAASGALSSLLDGDSAVRLAASETSAGGLRIRRWKRIEGGPDANRKLADWIALFREGAPRGGAVLETQLLATEVAGGLRRSEGWLRAIWGADEGAGRRQVSVEFRLESTPDDAERRITVLAADVVDAPSSRVFVDVAPSLLPPALRAENRLGELERAGTRDRLHGDTWLAMCGGAVGDFDGDGLEDMYICRPGGLPNWLLRRTHAGGFEETARASGVAFLDHSCGACAVDLDGDAFLDLVVAVDDALLVCWNDGRGRFTRIAALREPAGGPGIYSVVAGDPDRDGDADLFATRYVAGGVNGGVPTPYHDARNGAPNLYWRNEGGRRFVDGKQAAGLDKHDDRFSLAALFEDLDDDGDQDLYVTNDFGRNNYWVNDGAGRFVDAADERSVADGCAADQAASMGVSAADCDLDGDLDLHVTNMHSAAGARIARDPRFMARAPLVRDDYMRHARGNTLLLNEGGGRYRDASVEAGIGRGGWGWGALFTDLDADGLNDLHAPAGFITNKRADDLQSLFWRGVVAASPLEAGGASAEYNAGWAFLREAGTAAGGLSWNGRERDYSYLNLGRDGWVEVAGALGLDDEGDGRALLRMDLDDDGAEDLVLVSRTAPGLRLWRNPNGNPRSVSIELRDRVVAGATAFLETDRRKLRATSHAGEGYLGTSSPRLLFALQEGEIPLKLVVRWSDGVSESVALDAAPAPRRWLVRRGLGRVEAHPRPVAGLPAQRTGSEAAVAGGVRTVLVDAFPMDALKLAGDKPGLVRGILVSRAGDPLCARQKRLLEGIPGLVLVDAPLGTSASFDAALDVVLMEVYGQFEALDLPLLLLVDASDRLHAVHAGAFDPQACGADARVLAGLGPKQRAAEELSAGTLARGSRRDLGACAQVFDLLGLQDWSRSMREELRRRAGR